MSQQLSQQATRGGDSSNTPPANHTRLNLDTLIVGFSVAWPEDFDETTFKIWEECKEAAASDDLTEDAAADKFGEWQFQPSGARLGGGGGPYMAYVAKCDGITMQAMRRLEPFGETPNIRFNIGAMACWAHGSIEGIEKRLKDTITRWGGEIIGECISRVDVFCDLGHTKVDELHQLLADDQLICRARDISEYRQGRRRTGFSIGKSIMCRVYDKAHELKNDAIKAAAYEQIIWSGKRPDEVTRVEFQLRRDPLGSLGVKTFDDLKRKISSVWTYLTTKWLRFTSQQVNRSNPDRTPIAQVWHTVQKAGAAVLGKAAAAVRRVIRGEVNTGHLRAMAAGCLAKIAAVQKQFMDDMGDFAGFCIDELMQHEFQESVRLVLYRKVKELEASAPLDREFAC